MLEKLLLLLFHGKASLAGLLVVLSATGVAISGTIDDTEVDLTLRPAESPTCVEALLARAEARAEVAAAFDSATRDLARLRSAAREQADEQRKQLDELALRGAFEQALAELRAERDAALARIDQVADLTPCEDANRDTGVAVDVARLRSEYAAIVADARQRLTGALTKARQAFDLLVQNAPPKPPKQADQSSESASED